MAVDAYLQIDGIKGESADSNHVGWIEITSASWGVKQPRSATASTAVELALCSRRLPKRLGIMSTGHQLEASSSTRILR
jgi:hypothetical protein